jgi:hypothetical protein
MRCKKECLKLNAMNVGKKLQSHSSLQPPNPSIAEPVFQSEGRKDQERLG